MLKNHSEIPYKKEFQLHLYQIDDEVTQHNDPVYRSLTVGINGVDNSTEERINQPASCSYNGQKKSSGWLKRMLIGGAVLMGTGALAVGGYYCYLLGRAGAWGTSERSLLPHPENLMTLASHSVNSTSLIPVNDTQEADYFSHNPETSRSPYSYYEKNTAFITSDPDISKEPLTTNRAENLRNIHLETPINDNYYPLDSRLKIELANV